MIPEPIQRVGADMILWCQAHLAFLYAPLEIFTLLGEELFYMILIPMIYWCVHRGTGLRLLGLITTSSYINELLKWALHSPRPYWYDANIEGLRAESSFGPPSGHSQNAVTFWGYLTATAHKIQARRWLWPAFVVLVFLISFSRMLLGVHFPHDLILGWTAGGLFLVAYWKYMPRFEDWFRPQSLITQVATSFGISGAMLVAAVAYNTFLVGSVTIDPTLISNAALDQPAKAIAPFSLKAPVSYAGVIAGLGVGVAFMLRSADFSTGGSGLLRVARYVVGLIGVFAIYASGKFAPETLPEGLYLALRYLRYFTMIVWAIWLAPLLFVKIGLADKNSGVAR